MRARMQQKESKAMRVCVGGREEGGDVEHYPGIGDRWEKGNSG